MTYTYEYPRPCVTVDVAMIRQSENGDEILLIQRANPPFEGMWALPGGFIDMEEDLVEAAIRELKEETGIVSTQLKQFKTYGAPGRDPRARTITVVYYGFDSLNAPPTASDDAKNAQWFFLHNLPPMAFDHNKILHDLIEHLSIEKTKSQNI